MTATGSQVRSLHSVCELACLVNCGECWASPHIPCLHGTRGTQGYHVARLARARRRGLISAPDLAAVLDDVEVFANSTVVYDEAVTSGG